MASTEKISVTIDAEALEWMRRRARKSGSSLSAVMTEAARLLRQNEGRQRVLTRLGKTARHTTAQARAIRSEWA